MRTFSIILIFISATYAVGESVDDWPRWRGANFDGIAAPASHPFSNPFELRIGWKRKLGTGYSGVVVAGGKAVTMFSDGKNDYVTALSADRGEPLWQLSVGEAFPPRDGSSGGPVSTPAIANNVVYALGPRGSLVAVNLSNGKLLWKRDLVSELGAATPHWGFTTSPLITNENVIVITGGANQAITAFNRINGTTAWHSGSDNSSYQSPILARMNGKDVIVAAGDKVLYVLDPKTGRELIHYEHSGEGFYGQIINPVRIGTDKLLLTNKPEESKLLNFDKTFQTIWTSRDLKLNYSTPVAHGNLIFGYSARFLTAVDQQTGTARWRSRLPGDGFPIIVDDYLVIITKRGMLAVAETSADTYREKASLQVFSRLVWTPPAFAEGRIYLRDSYEEIAAVDVIPVQAASTKKEDQRGVISGSDFAKWVAEAEKSPNAAELVKQYLAEHASSPVFEGDRFAHILYAGPEHEVVVRSDATEIGDEIAMKRVGSTDLRYLSLELEPDARISYQFIRDMQDPIADPRNPHNGISLNLPGAVSVLAMPQAKPMLGIADEKLQGKVVDLELTSPEVKAEHLKWGGKRAIKVYLPSGYDAQLNQHYPTLYVLLGEEMMKDAKLLNLIDHEIGRSLPPFIGVFVTSTSAYELARTFRDPHAKMIATQVIPWIDQQFRTDSHPSKRLIVGVDEAGFASLEIGLRYPKVFGGIISHSIFALTGGDEDLFKLIDQSTKSNQRFYLDWGKYDARRQADRLDVPGVTRTAAERLKSHGQNVESHESNDGSPVALIGPRTIKALQTLLQDQSASK